MGGLVEGEMMGVENGRTGGGRNSGVRNGRIVVGRNGRDGKWTD
jgi:hypothetical protein